MSWLRCFKLYRRWVGGRWEQWYHDDGHFYDWYHWDTDAEKRRPHICCKGTPTIEVYD